jgi:hypothetical protein
MRHARSYVAALREGFRRGAEDRVSERRISHIEADFARYIHAITDQTGRIRLPTGEIVPKVPFSVLWLAEGETFIGETHVRHRLNDYLIKEGGPRRLWHPPRAAPAGLRQADPGARARGVPSRRPLSRAGHVSRGQCRIRPNHRGERRRAGERDPRPGRQRAVAPLLDCAVVVTLPGPVGSPFRLPWREIARAFLMRIRIGR